MLCLAQIFRSLVHACARTGRDMPQERPSWWASTRNVLDSGWSASECVNWSHITFFCEPHTQRKSFCVYIWAYSGRFSDILSLARQQVQNINMLVSICRSAEKSKFGCYSKLRSTTSIYCSERTRGPWMILLPSCMFVGESTTLRTKTKTILSASLIIPRDASTQCVLGAEDSRFILVFLLPTSKSSTTSGGKRRRVEQNSDWQIWDDETNAQANSAGGLPANTQRVKNVLLNTALTCGKKSACHDGGQQRLTVLYKLADRFFSVSYFGSAVERFTRTPEKSEWLWKGYEVLRQTYVTTKNDANFYRFSYVVGVLIPSSIGQFQNFVRNFAC